MGGHVGGLKGTVDKYADSVIITPPYSLVPEHVSSVVLK